MTDEIMVEVDSASDYDGELVYSPAETPRAATNTVRFQAPASLLAAYSEARAAMQAAADQLTALRDAAIRAPRAEGLACRCEPGMPIDEVHLYLDGKMVGKIESAFGRAVPHQGDTER